MFYLKVQATTNFGNLFLEISNFRYYFRIPHSLNRQKMYFEIIFFHSGQNTGETLKKRYTGVKTFFFKNLTFYISIDRESKTL
jgi:hypothetical protein